MLEIRVVLRAVQDLLQSAPMATALRGKGVALNFRLMLQFGHFLRNAIFNEQRIRGVEGCSWLVSRGPPSRRFARRAESSIQRVAHRAGGLMRRWPEPVLERMLTCSDRGRLVFAAADRRPLLAARWRTLGRDPYVALSPVSAGRGRRDRPRRQCPPTRTGNSAGHR